MILSLTAFSQKDTIIPTKCFPIPVVKLITKDLMSGDQAKVELKLTTKELEETQLKVSLKDSIISKMTEKEITLAVMLFQPKICVVFGMDKKQKIPK